VYGDFRRRSRHEFVARHRRSDFGVSRTQRRCQRRISGAVADRGEAWMISPRPRRPAFSEPRLTAVDERERQQELADFMAFEGKDDCHSRTRC
jgi:hypothetical protein